MHADQLRSLDKSGLAATLMARSAGAVVAGLACLWAWQGVLGAQELLQPYSSLTDYGLASLSAQTFSNDSSSGISASIGAPACLPISYTLPGVSAVLSTASVSAGGCLSFCRVLCAPQQS